MKVQHLLVVAITTFLLSGCGSLPPMNFSVPNVGLSQKKVDAELKSMTVSAAALKALHSLGYSTPAASGPGYWKFDGELLDERRQRIEAEQFDETTSNNV